MAPLLLAPGFVLGDRYELLCPLGKGGMAEVWLARLQGSAGFERLFAIKTILPELASEGNFRSMFLDEVHITARIEHRNVARVLDLGEHDGLLYAVMEYVDGDSLARLLRVLGPTRLPVNVVLRIAIDVCAGLHAAHELRDERGALLDVVHRDVSPHNVLLDRHGVTRVIDFGIAKARDRAAKETTTGATKGKLLYMSPEQAAAGNVDRRSDVFAVGALVYHLLAGRAPYDAENQLSTLTQLATGTPPPSLPRSVPADVVAIVEQALAFEPSDRFSTAAAMSAAFSNALLALGGAIEVDVALAVRPALVESGAERSRLIEHAIGAARERADAALRTQNGVTLQKEPPARRSMVGVVIALLAIVATGFGVRFATRAREPVAAAPAPSAAPSPVVVVAPSAHPAPSPAPSPAASPSASSSTKPPKSLQGPKPKGSAKSPTEPDDGF